MPRVAVFVDGNNFYYIQRDNLGWNVNMQKFLRWCSGFGHIADAFYYVSSDVSTSNDFLDNLPNSGFALVRKHPKTDHQTGMIIKANMDVEIAIDVVARVDTYDVAVLVSGDSDLACLVDFLRSRGKTCAVVSTRGHVSHEMRSAAGINYWDLFNMRKELEYIKR